MRISPSTTNVVEDAGVIGVRFFMKNNSYEGVLEKLQKTQQDIRVSRADDVFAGLHRCRSHCSGFWSRRMILQGLLHQFALHQFALHQFALHQFTICNDCKKVSSASTLVAVQKEWPIQSDHDEAAHCPHHCTGPDTACKKCAYAACLRNLAFGLHGHKLPVTMQPGLKFVVHEC